MKKSGLILLLIVALTFCFSGGVLAADPWDGTTTDVTWYSTDKTSFEISTPAQLAGLASIVNAGTDTFVGKTIKLTADLDLGGVYTSGDWNTTSSKNWTPIGNSNSSTKQFAGTFNGNGKTISNIYINATTQYQGMFGYIATSGKVKNLSILSGSITSTSTSVGGIAGYSYGYIVNCSNAASITGGGEVGGIAGDFSGKGSLLNSFNEGTVSGTGTSVRFVAGLVGNFSSNGEIMNCYNLGDVGTFAIYGAGIASQVSSASKVINCYNAGNITASGTMYVANLIGKGDRTASNYQNVYGLKTNTVNASLPAMNNPANTSLETAALKNSADLAALTSTLGSNFKEATGSSYTYPVLIWQNGGSYPADDADGLAIDSVSAANGSVTVVMNKALRYTVLDKSQFSLTAAINQGEKQNITINSVSQKNDNDTTTVTVNFSTIDATTADQNVVMAVSYNGVSPIAAASFKINQSTEWPAYGEAPSTGDGTAGNPYLLSSAENLAWFAAQVNGGKNVICAKLTADIDLDGKTWVPIGNSPKTYGGSFDGNGYAVKNMKIESDKSYLGFFGVIGSAGFVKNFGIESGSITSADGGSMTGGICGQNQGIILNCYNKADINVSGSNVGGIVGIVSSGKVVNCYNNGDILTSRDDVGGIAGSLGSTSAVVTNVYNTGDVTSTKEVDDLYSPSNAGGIIGNQYGPTTLSNSYNAGNVTAGDGDYAISGGVIGYYQNGTVTNCYYLQTFLLNRNATGAAFTMNDEGNPQVGKNITGTASIGKDDLKDLTSTNLGKNGFVADDDNINSGYPILSWQVEGASYPDDELNGLAIDSVRAENGTVYVTLNKKLAYRTLAKGNFAIDMHLSTEPDYYSAAVKTLKQDSSGDKTVVALTFTSYAETTSAQNGLVKVSYLGGTAVEGNMVIAPTKEWKLYPADGFAGGEGSQSNPYQIATAEQLVYLSDQVNLGETYADKYFVLTADLDIGGKYWQPIGSYDNSNATARLAFAGNFDGQNHAIHNLYIPYSGVGGARYQYAGLFGWTTGSISNLSVTGLVQGKQNGGIAARNEGTITNCTNYVDLYQYSTTNYYMGGIAAYSSGNISDCVNYGCMASSLSSYGIANIAGIAGYVDNTAHDVAINRCANFGTISGENYIGGIVGCGDRGSSYKLTIEECYNEGEISGTYAYIAGINGSSNGNTSIINCYNTGNIYGMTSSISTAGNGGITVRGGHIVNCYNTGNLSSIPEGIAHIVCDVTESNDTGIANCYYLNDGVYNGATTSCGYIASFDITAMKGSDMQSAAFVTKLNGKDGTAFVADTNNVNNGYPVLAWAADLNSNAPTGLKSGENKITGLDTEKTYEYKNATDIGYTSVKAGSSEITGLNSGTYNVRYVQTDTVAPSAYATVTIGGDLSGTAYIPDTTSIGNFNYPYNMYGKMCYVNTQGLPKDGDVTYQWYRYDKDHNKYTRISGATERAYTPTAKDIGYYLYVEVYVNGHDGCISATTTNTIVKQSTLTPDGLTAVDCSAVNTNDGKITGLDSSLPYEYKLSTDSDYTAVTDGATEITGLAPGTYNVRCKDTDLFSVSSVASYTVNDFATSLATAQNAAKADLTKALGTYKEADYSADNWTALNKAKTDGDTAITAATILADVATAKKTAIDGMAAVKNSIASAKDDAKAALDTALGGYKESDYYAEQWTALNKAKTDGDAAIEAATDMATIDTAKQTAITAMAAVKTKATLESSSVNATVTVDAQSANSFLVPYQSVTVNSALAESYGYSDGVDIAQGVSTLDVLIKAHEICYGSSFDGSQLLMSGSGIAKIFNISTYNCGFAVNGVSPHGDTLNESPWGNYYDGYALSQAQVSDNDQVEFFLYQDSSALDNYGWFEQSGAKTESITAKAGSDFSLTLKGYAIGWYGCSEASVITNKTTPLEGAQLALVGSDGKITDIKNAVTGSDGSVTLKVSKEGSYLLTAYVPSSDIKSGTTPLLMPIAALTITAADTVVDVKNMTDVKDKAWYYDSVAYVLANGIMYGSSSTTFDPDGNVTRGQFVTILGRYAGIKDSNSSSPATTSFADVNATSYYASHVAWAAEKGITSGTSATTFDPNAKITRQDMAAMILRFASVEGITLPNGSGAAIFADDGDIAAYAKTAVYSMAEAKIINGVGDNKFSPKEYATRAQAATMIRLLIAYKG